MLRGLPAALFNPAAIRSSTSPQPYLLGNARAGFRRTRSTQELHRCWFNTAISIVHKTASSPRSYNRAQAAKILLPAIYELPMHFAPHRCKPLCDWFAAQPVRQYQRRQHSGCFHSCRHNNLVTALLPDSRPYRASAQMHALPHITTSIQRITVMPQQQANGRLYHADKHISLGTCPVRNRQT